MSLLTEAFDADPYFRFLAPDDGERAALLSEVMRGNVELARAAGMAFGLKEGGRVDGVCLWYGPGTYPAPLWQAATVRGGSVARTVAGWARTPSRARPGVIASALRIQTLLEEAHPPGAFWYLMILGVDAARRGRGLGSRMLRDALAMADRDGVPSVLETSKPENLPLYRRHGFRVTRATHLDGSPPVWSMQRAPGGHP